jgi:hypothetical protein
MKSIFPPLYAKPGVRSTPPSRRRTASAARCPKTASAHVRSKRPEPTFARCRLRRPTCPELLIYSTGLPVPMCPNAVEAPGTGVAKRTLRGEHGRVCGRDVDFPAADFASFAPALESAFVRQPLRAKDLSCHAELLISSGFLAQFPVAIRLLDHGEASCGASLPRARSLGSAVGSGTNILEHG